MVTQSRATTDRDTVALVIDAQRGDRQALDRLLTAHLTLIYNVIGRALNGHPDVDDIVQETMLQIMGGLPGLREPERFRAWAVTIAFRQVQTHLRRRRTGLWRQRTAPTDLADLADPIGDFAERTIAALMLTGQRRELAEAVRWLDEDDRQLLALWWQEAAGELTRAELATALAITPQHTAVRLQRMKTRLDAARVLVRVLHARQDCPGLQATIRGWSGTPDPLWRKRLARHIRDCSHCVRSRRGLIAPERLLLGVAALPLPVAVAAAAQAIVEGAGPGLVAPTAATFWHSAIAHVQQWIHNKVVVTTAGTVAAAGGLAYTVYETPLTDPGPPPATAEPAAPTSAPAPASSTPPRAQTTGVTVADIYVAPNGSDSGDGSEAHPYATLRTAVARVRPGQTIALRAGVYRPTDPVVIDTDGTADRRITLSNYRDEQPIIDAAGVPAGEWTITHRASFWTVQGIAIRNSKSHAYVCRSCRYNVFRRLSMHDNAESGLLLRDPGTVGNQVLDSDFFRNYQPGKRGDSGIGLGIKFGVGEGNVIRGCRAFHNAESGFDLGEFGSAVRIENSWAYGNGVNRWNEPGWRSSANGFTLGGGEPATVAAHVVVNSAAWDNIQHGFAHDGNRGALVLNNNTAFRNGAAGFFLRGAPVVLHANAAVGNAVTSDVSAAARADANAWSGKESMFRSVDPATAEGPRRPDGALPATDFLITGTAVGASMTG